LLACPLLTLPLPVNSGTTATPSKSLLVNHHGYVRNHN